jgi:hypothetical protein
MKICTKCKELLELEAFNFKSRKNNTRQAVCRECLKPYKIGYYHDNKKAHLARNRAMKDKLKEFVKDYKSTHPCTNCGEPDYRCLDFHHTDPKDKDFEVSKLYQYGSKPLIEKEIKKCIVLCANCHRKLHN